MTFRHRINRLEVSGRGRMRLFLLIFPTGVLHRRSPFLPVNLGVPLQTHVGFSSFDRNTSHEAL